MLRVTLLAGILGLFSFSQAERLVFLPTANRLGDMETKAEYLFEGLSLANRKAYLGFGFGGRFELELTNDRPRDFRKDRTSFNGSVNLLPALPDFGAGFSLGVIDGANVTQEGRAVFGVFTLRSSNSEAANANSSTDLSIGFGTYPRFKGIFIAVQHPFTNEFRLLAEYDSRVASVGMELIPLKGVSLKWVVREKQTYLGASYSMRF